MYIFHNNQFIAVTSDLGRVTTLFIRNTGESTDIAVTSDLGRVTTTLYLLYGSHSYKLR